MPANDTSVSGWVQQLCAGDKGLPVEKLWERYCERLIELARVRLGKVSRSVVDEEDVALSAFDSFCRGALHGKFPHLYDRDNLWRLLVTITARKAYKLILKAGVSRRETNTVLDEAALAKRAGADRTVVYMEQFIACGPTPEFAAQAADEYHHLLSRLGDDQLREVALLKMAGFTNEEIAAKQGCVPRTIYRRLSMIRSLWLQSAS